MLRLYSDKEGFKTRCVVWASGSWVATMTSDFLCQRNPLLFLCAWIKHPTLNNFIYPKVLGIQVKHMRLSGYVHCLFLLTCTTCTTQQRENGNVTRISIREIRVNKWEQIPGPSSQTENIKIILEHQYSKTAA